MDTHIKIWGLASALALAGCAGGPGNSSDSSQAQISSSEGSVSSQSSSQNNNAQAALVISEIVAKSADDSFLGGNDWIELHNTSQQTVNLGDYALADSASEIISLPATSIAPGQYVVIAAVDAEEVSPPLLSVPFKLGQL